MNRWIDIYRSYINICMSVSNFTNRNWWVCCRLYVYDNMDPGTCFHVSNQPNYTTKPMRTDSPVRSKNALLHINDPQQHRKTESERETEWECRRENERRRERQQNTEDKRAPSLLRHTHKHATDTHRQASLWNMTAPWWRRWGWGKPYCNNLILWSLIVSCCSSLPDRVRWAYVKHISPLAVGALPACSNAAQRHKPRELLKADRPDNLPLGLQRQVQSQP